MSIADFLPVFNEDPFLKYRPFPETPSNYFVAHWHEIFGSFLFYLTVQWLSPIVATRYMGDTYKQLSRKVRINFDIHVVSMVQCIVSLLLVIPTWNQPSWSYTATDAAGRVLTYYPYGGMVTAVTVGYFVWDLLVCLQHLQLFGAGFLFHAVAALVVFGGCLSPFCIPWMPAFLLFELSTPFVNINWFASKLPAGTISETVTVVNGIMLLVVFFFVRVVWGIYAVTNAAMDMFAVWDQLFKPLPFTILGLNFLLNLLNIYWFYRMVLIAQKKAKGRKTTRQTEKELATKIQ